MAKMSELTVTLAAHLEVTALTVPSNAIAVWAHVTVLLVHVKMVAVKTDGQE
ncbi:hypothetical protein DPMN_103272 [Dreissena polymorpha]|uniref:Uncharacterized protein n=1 Tax=Dreissena polymorpha TaxID=45954 RepID=A0A9D4HAQ8_DREPO|nr:hypothetical protein DPMN_103272 [Dreissena polymorpha]